MVPDKVFLVVAHIFIHSVSSESAAHADIMSMLSHVFVGALIDANKPGYTKNAIDYLIRDLLKRAFRGNAVKSNEVNKPRQRTNSHDSDDNDYTRNDKLFFISHH